MSRKAFIFSIDGLFAIVLVVILGALFIAYYSVEEGSTQAFESSATAASDAAIVGFYLNKDSGDFGLSSSISLGSEIGRCSTMYIYNPNNGPSQAVIGNGITEKKFCKEIP